MQPGALGRGGSLETFLERGMGNYVVEGSAKVGIWGVLQQAGRLRVNENSQATAAYPVGLQFRNPVLILSD